MTLRAVLVEDQLMFQQLLRVVLESFSDVEVVATANGVAAGVQACQKHLPDLLILDLDLPDGPGIEVARALNRWHPRGRAMVLSVHASSFVCPRDLQQTVYAVVDKSRTYDTLRQKVEELLRFHQGQELPSPSVTELHILTPRELEVFAFIGRGMTNRQIATQLMLSLRTIETHRRNIITKFGVSGAALVHLAGVHSSLQRLAREVE